MKVQTEESDQLAENESRLNPKGYVVDAHDDYHRFGGRGGHYVAARGT